MYRWQGYLIDEIMSKANDKGIYSLDHALTCDLGIQQIQIKSPHDPKWLKSIQSWDIMNYTRNPHDNTYESIASLPIPRNRNILIKGQMIDITDKNSVYSKIRCRTLCIVAQLFTNYSSSTDRCKYTRSSIIQPGRLKTVTELNDEFGELDDTGEGWNDLRGAIVSNNWDVICSAGNETFIADTYYATLNKLTDQTHSGAIVINKVFKIVDNTSIRYCDYNSLTGKVHDTARIGQYGHHNIPAKNKLRKLIHVPNKDDPAPDNGTIYGFALIPTPSSENKRSWDLTYNYGIVPRSYIPLGRDKYQPFKTISKQFRNLGHTINDGILKWDIDNINGVPFDWDRIMRGLNHARIRAQMKNMMWRIFTNRIYMGHTAYLYLEEAHKLPNHRHNYQYCFLCQMALCT